MRWNWNLCIFSMYHFFLSFRLYNIAEIKLSIYSKLIINLLYILSNSYRRQAHIKFSMKNHKKFPPGKRFAINEIIPAINPDSAIIRIRTASNSQTARRRRRGANATTRIVPLMAAISAKDNAAVMAAAGCAPPLRFPADMAAVRGAAIAQCCHNHN